MTPVREERAGADGAAGAAGVDKAGGLGAADGEEAPGGSGALHGVMAALAWLPRLLALHVAWVVLVLCGGVIGGIAPATATLVSVLRGDVPGADPFEGDGGFGGAARAVLGRFRAELGPANGAAGPFLVIGLAAGANLALGIAGALPAWVFPAGFAAAGILGAVSVLALFHAIALHVLRPDAPSPMLWRGALAGTVLLPTATVSWTITLVAAGIVSAIIQPVGLLLGGGILVAVTTFVLVRSWQSRLDAATV
ncbi:DUF624 domain-containing protein [Brachybacterium sp. MASK1Z-5]|uniref:DUF624 domain-containing protein n=1 Tax=Brachybacterium halotolerans TaxID=2795215 RepID=A0ABS1B9V2_9MICO|nr:DUF624 domain-containing protein [Brachybacterium halotolerans]MBK0331431.1 DUF624 domain-containing protein [Brachybacterium halotolerans]